MNKFQKLSQLNKDIELLENAGKLKAAEVLHNKFIKEAQYAMPQMMTTMMPQMMMPPMMSMMPQMMARPAVPVVQTAVPRPVANPTPTPAPIPVAQPRTTPVQTIGTNPGVNPGVNPAPKPQPSPGNMGLGQDPDVNPFDNYYKDPRTGKLIFIDPDPSSGGGVRPGTDPGGYDVTPPGNYQYGKGGLQTVPPPGTITPPSNYSDPMNDPRVKQYWDRIKGNDFLSGKQKQDMLDQFMRSIGLK